MFHAINAWLRRHYRQILDLGVIHDNVIAAAHGWQSRRVGGTTWSYGDPRFIYRSFGLTESTSGCTFCDNEVAEWFDDARRR